MQLELLTPFEYQRIMESKPAIIIPVGAMEWHDNHLPFGLDYLKIEKIAQLLAEKVGCISSPPITFGYPKNYSEDGEHSIGTFCPDFDALYNYIFALGKLFVEKGFRVIYFLSGHYERSQIYMLKLISRRLVEFGREKKKKIIADVRMEPDFTIKDGISKNWKEDTAAVNTKLPYYSGDHAGFYETSIGLYLFPELVRQDQIKLDYFHPTEGKPTAEWGNIWINMILDKASIEINNALQGKVL